MKRAAYFGRCFRRAMKWDGHGHGLVKSHVSPSSLDEDPGFDLSIYSTAAELRASLIEDFGLTPQEAQEHTRHGTMLHVPDTRVYIFNSDGNYGRLDVRPQQMPNLTILQRQLTDRIRGAIHVRSKT